MDGMRYANDEAAKAKRIRLCSLAQPHYMAFHLTWFSFFLVGGAARQPLWLWHSGISCLEEAM